MKKLLVSMRDILAVVVVLLVFTACAKQEALFSKADLTAAQKLYGLNFQEQEIDTMYQYLLSNRSGYDSSRSVTIDNNVFPSLLFDPLPTGWSAKIEKAPVWPELATVSRPKSDVDLAFLSVSQLGKLIQQREMTSVELTKLYLKRLKKFDAQLHCVINLTEDRAMAHAARADSLLEAGVYLGPLHGIPFGVKDLMSVKGYPTTWGAAPYQAQMIDETAAVVRLLDEAGAVLIAKLSSGALARGDVWFGEKTRNPWDLEQGASGSSAGSASAVAAGLIGFAIGTETLGSIISPSTRCGVTGLRPTYGKVSRFGTMSLSWSMDKIGPICRTALDCGLVLEAITKPDEQDPTLLDHPINLDFKTDLKDLKIAYLKQDFEKDTTEKGRGAQLVLDQLRKQGAYLEEVELPNYFGWETYDVILRAEAGAFFDELVRSGEVDQMVLQTKSSRANSLRQSRFIPAVEYLQANRHRRVLIEKMDELMKDYDVLISPSFGNKQMLYTNLSGHPSLCIPLGLDEKEHPYSITFVGKLFGEGAILNVANGLQKTRAEDFRPPLFNK